MTMRVHYTFAYHQDKTHRGSEYSIESEDTTKARTLHLIKTSCLYFTDTIKSVWRLRNSMTTKAEGGVQVLNQYSWEVNT